MIIKCEICNKPIKENTDGNSKYCQGHDLFELHNSKIREENKKKASFSDATIKRGER